MTSSTHRPRLPRRLPQARLPPVARRACPAPDRRELLGADVILRPVVQRNGTWFHFVDEMNDLTVDEQRVLADHRVVRYHTRDAAGKGEPYVYRGPGEAPNRE